MTKGRGQGRRHIRVGTRGARESGTGTVLAVHHQRIILFLPLSPPPPDFSPLPTMPMPREYKERLDVPRRLSPGLFSCLSMFIRGLAVFPCRFSFSRTIAKQKAQEALARARARREAQRARSGSIDVSVLQKRRALLRLQLMPLPFAAMFPLLLPLLAARPLFPGSGANGCCQDDNRAGACPNDARGVREGAAGARGAGQGAAGPRGGGPRARAAGGA